MHAKNKLSAIGELLAERRKLKGLTQSEAGALIGVQKAMVSKIENGSTSNINSIYCCIFYTFTFHLFNLLFKFRPINARIFLFKFYHFLSHVSNFIELISFVSL